LATQPASFSTIIKKLDEHHLISPHESQKGWSRVLIEKPFGYDLDSAMALQQEITRHLNENQIYRIDHYLAKEGVENLFSLRFAGAAFEPLWNSSHIDNIQITLGEDIGIGTRGHFWEGTGFLRDILQNHLMQLLALIAMDPPISHDAPAAHAEKIKVLQAVRPFPIHAMDEFILRGQYGPGLIQGSPVLAYRQEQNVSDNSFVETYAAAKIFIDNERWHNVPFYIRGGKRLPKQIAEIAVTFKNKGCPETQKQDVLFIRIQPNPAIFLKTTCRSGSKRELIPISISRPQVFMDAYEKLLYDAIGGDDRLFVPIEEQLAAWRLLTPVLQYWSSHRNVTFPNYDAGSWGPSQADLMLKAEGRQWQLLEN
jgi:glucose-6-phosphate 1-dehydrogenase